MKIQLRPYQDEALGRVAEVEARGVRRILGVAATGLGKTVMFVAKAANTPGRTLILAHRDELIGQAAAKVIETWPGELSISPSAYESIAGVGRASLVKDCYVAATRPDLGIVKAKANDVSAARVIVASVQTLAREQRLADLVASGAFALVIVDEAHHSAADSYRTITAALGCDDPDGPVKLGVTATPDRGDGEGLDEDYDEIAFSYDLLWGIRSGYLCDVRGKQVGLAGLDVKGLKIRRGDYEAGAAGAALEAAGAPEHIVQAWREHAEGRRTLVFTPTVALAEAVAARYREAGIAAEWVSGSTPQDERRAILARYSSGETTVVANCAVLTEGYDEPRTDCIVVARPTKSRALYTQIVGRGTRKHPDKADLLVLDVVGASESHSLMTVPSLFGVPGSKMDEKGLTASEAVAEWEEEEIAAGRLAARDAEMFRQMRSEGIAWVKAHDPATGHTAYLRRLGTKGPKDRLPTVVLVAMDSASEEWAVGLRYEDGRSRVLHARVALELAQGVGEDLVRKLASSQTIQRADASWRKRRPTEGQLAAAKKWRLPVDPAWTSGELSERLDAHIEVRLAKRRPLLDLSPMEAS